MRKNSVTVKRFNIFLHKIKCARSDKDILLAGWDLVDDWRGFGYNWLAYTIYTWIKEGYEGITQLTQSQILTKKKII